MKYLLSFPLLFVFMFVSRGDEKDTMPSSELKHNAMKIMEDIVSHEPASDLMEKISSEQGYAIWGKIFGDAQIAALVALKSDKGKADDDGILCLLLWHDGWKFTQVVGTVSTADISYSWSPIPMQEWNWSLKRRAVGEPYYVVSGLDPNILSYEEHPSWLCDQKSHALLPTGWPKNAIPSLSGGTITFQRWEKSGYVFEIDAFDGKPGKNLVTYTNDGTVGFSIFTVIIPDPVTGKRITWRIAPSTEKFEAYHDKRSLLYRPADENWEPIDATIDVQWGEGPYPNDATNFLIWRLTGIERNAQVGVWDEDTVDEDEQWKKMVNQRPARTVINGSPEAVKAFSWPLIPTPAGPVDEKSK